MPQSYLQYTVKHYGWWPSPYCYWPHRCRLPHVTDLACRLPHSRRRGYLLTEPWVATGHLLLPSPAVGRCAATRWSASGCHPSGKRVSQDCQLSPQRQMGGGRCGALTPLPELWDLNIQRCWRDCSKSVSWLEENKTITVFRFNLFSLHSALSKKNIFWSQKCTKALRFALHYGLTTDHFDKVLEEFEIILLWIKPEMWGNTQTVALITLHQLLQLLLCYRTHTTNKFEPCYRQIMSICSQQTRNAIVWTSHGAWQSH